MIIVSDSAHRSFYIVKLKQLTGERRREAQFGLEGDFNSEKENI